MNKLADIFTAVEETEKKVLPFFVHNPASQQWAGLAFLAEDEIFNLILHLHAVPTTPVAAVPSVAATGLLRAA